MDLKACLSKSEGVRDLVLRRSYISTVARAGAVMCVVKIIDLWNRSLHALNCMRSARTRRSRSSLTAERCGGDLSAWGKEAEYLD